MNVEISEERPDSEAAQALIGELDAVPSPLYPAESRHGYSVEKLIRDGVAFFVIRCNREPAACGGVRIYGTEYGELKRMYVRPPFRGTGLAKMMIAHIETYTHQHGVSILRLETGVHQSEAISLYEGSGFERIGPFGEYREDPLSVFYEKVIMLSFLKG
jgi:GNAT superfamily N-acetyltransferase